MKKITMLATLLGAATLAVSGAALAADVPGADGGASSTLWTAPVAPGQPILWMPTGSTDPRARSIAQAKPSSSPYTVAPASAIGMDVMTAEGTIIGEVDRVDGSQIIVTTGNQLGVGSHDVALYWPQLRPTGSGDLLKLQTTLSSADVRALPEIKR